MDIHGTFYRVMDLMIWEGPPDEEKMYQLRTVELRVFDNVAFGLMMDLEVMHDVGKFCFPDDPFTTTAVYAGNHILNLLAAGKQLYVLSSFPLGSSYAAHRLKEALRLMN